MLVYTARVLIPIASSPLWDGAVAVEDGRIVNLGPAAEVIEAAGQGAEVRALGEAALMPGLVNAHTHVELSWMASGRPPGGSYTDWLRGLLELREREDEETARAAAEAALGAMAARGTVAVGDLSNRTWAAGVLARSGLHGIAFHELLSSHIAHAEQRIEEAAERLDRIEAEADVAAASDRLRVILTPHAPHTVSAPLLRALAGRAEASNELLSIHVSESVEECELLAGDGGALDEFLREHRFRDPAWEPPKQTPVEYLDRLGVLSARTLAVHCVHLEHHDHSKLQARGATVVTCPRSNRYLGVGSAPVPALLREGVPIALGTDSLASNPDLDLFAEIAALREEHPGLAPAAILRIATLNGATALGLADRLGSIEPGKLAELVVVRIDDEEEHPLEALCSNPSEVHRLSDAPWSAGP
ncbi:MAG: amidohydrolase family protein [bacterium]|nr:amidohydrolase family protein [bacterium]